MALIRRFEIGHREVSVHKTEVDCYYQSIVDGDSRVILHLSTFGSSDRQSKPKSSQSIQLDEARAKLLIDLLNTTFPGISRSRDSSVGRDTSTAGE